MDFGPGDVLVLYTDGLVETQNRAGEPFGYPRLAEAVGQAARPGAHAEEIRQGVLNRFVQHSRAVEPQDDVSILVVKRLSTLPGPRSSGAG